MRILAALTLSALLLTGCANTQRPGDTLETAKPCDCGERGWDKKPPAPAALPEQPTEPPPGPKPRPEDRP